jgi:hypothetical protein
MHFQLKFSKLQAMFYHLDSPDFAETHTGRYYIFYFLNHSVLENRYHGLLAFTIFWRSEAYSDSKASTQNIEHYHGTVPVSTKSDVSKLSNLSCSLLNDQHHYGLILPVPHGDGQATVLSR